MNTDTIFELEIESTTAYDKMHVRGGVTLGGTLNPAFLNNYNPNHGESYTFINATGAVNGNCPLHLHSISISILTLFFSAGKFDTVLYSGSTLAYQIKGQTVVANVANYNSASPAPPFNDGVKTTQSSVIITVTISVLFAIMLII